MEGKYANDPEWASITPIQLDDGSENTMPLATIAYPSEYLEATSYLRAVMAANEMSERALKLTEHVISMNPAHYTVWIYRAKILFALNKDLLDELAWLNGVSLKYLKNYQIWYVKQFHKSGPESGDLRSSILIPSCSLEMRAGRGEQVKLTFYIRHHRQVLLESQTHFPNIPEKELDFLMEMFAQDSKNYHVWTYRHWLVRRFNLWDLPREIEDVESLIKADVRNNSAWNHRYMLRFGPRSERAGMENSGFDGVSPHQKGVCAVVDEDLVDAELQYAKEQILRAPENRSPWWYARGVLRAAGRGVQDWEEFARKFVVEGEVRSSHAVELLADVYALKEGSAEKAVEMLTLLKERYDPIRKNYWDYRIQQVVV